jgi:hypothetical protein
VSDDEGDPILFETESPTTRAFRVAQESECFAAIRLGREIGERVPDADVVTTEA